MKSFNSFYFVLSALLFLTACKKEVADITSSVPVIPNERILLASAHTNTNYAFEYNGDKTIKSYSWSNGVYKSMFNYSNNKLVITEFANTKKNAESTYELFKGIAQKGTYNTYDANGNLKDIYTTVYTYNGSGQLIIEEYTKNGISNGYVKYSYYADGDMFDFTVRDQNGNITWQTSFEYDKALLDKSGSFGQFNSNATGSIFPKKATHLITKQAVNDNNTATLYTYTYTLDSKGYVLTGLIKSNAGMLPTDSWTNTWE